MDSSKNFKKRPFEAYIILVHHNVKYPVNKSTITNSSLNQQTIKPPYTNNRVNLYPNLTNL